MALPTRCDVLVIGSGAGGLSAAVTAASHGLDVLLVEKEPQFGGTTAWSGGWMWVPRNHLARAAGIHEDLEGPLTYLRHELGAGFDEDKVRMFLEQAPKMVQFFEEHTALRFFAGNTAPDFHGRTPGAAVGGRSVCAAPFDGRTLGKAISRLRMPPAEFTIAGMGLASGADMRHFFRAARSLGSALYASRRLLRHWWQRAMYGQGMQLVNGHALAGALLKTALDLRITAHTSTAAVALVREGERVIGARLRQQDSETTVTAERGVVLACGGFPHDAQRKRQLFPHAPSGSEHWSAAPPANTGDGLRLGESTGGMVETGFPNAGAWAPVSRVPRADGSFMHFPHLMERAKPGLVAVTAAGERFVNEADPYHDFMNAMFAATPAGQPPRAWLICDHRFQRRYGLGATKPFPFPLSGHVRSGYLRAATSLYELAAQCGINGSQLIATIDAYNADVAAGRPDRFGRGSTPYNRVQGDAEHAPDPCNAAIVRAPFYAVQVVAGSLGTFAGLRTDPCARVLDAHDQPIAGLYAAGNDMASVMAGHYPSGGITLGPAMTFGYVAGLHLAELLSSSPRAGNFSILRTQEHA
jgi:succinate dehydrogenase/fumarate reductase flavoprotein subunit